MRMRDFGDGGHILHLERQRAGAFDIDHARVFLHPLLDARADGGIVKLNLHPQPLQLAVDEIPCRAIHRIREQHMVPRAQQRDQRHVDRGQPRRRNQRMVRPLQHREGLLERLRRRAAVAAIAQVRDAPFLIRHHLGEILEQHRGSAMHRRIHRTGIPLRVTAEIDQLRIEMGKMFFVGHKVQPY